jgi:2'-hydroxyisoflavone reductase
VIGGTLFIGRVLVKELVKGGHEVTVLHRKSRHNLGKKVASITVDRNDPDAIKKALAGKDFDVVYDNVYDWERGTTAAQVEATARACGNNLHRYIFMSSVAAYGDGLNHHEGDALAPDDHSDAYIRNKAMSERTLFRMHQRNGFPVVTLRPPFIYGPGNPFYREAFFWDRLREGRPIILPGDGRRLMQFVYIKDLVTACLKVMEAEDVEAFARAAGKEATFVRWPRERILRAGGHPMGPKLYFGQYFDMPAITVVVNKAQRVLKFKPLDFATALKETYRWYVRNNPFAKQDYSFEDALIDAAPAPAYSAPVD